jgi:plastocyanin domain-containing protein
MTRSYALGFLAIVLAAGVGCDNSKKDPAPPAKPTEAVKPAATPVVAGKGGRVEITVTEKGYEPEKIAVKKGEPVTLVFTRKTEKTCANEVVMDTGTEKINKPLPLNQPVEFAITFAKSGEIKYGCSMDKMIAGYVTVE